MSLSQEKQQPDFPANLIFFSDVLTRYIYTTEQLTGKISGYFTLLAVLISCLGLFGFAAFIAERRTKEIGIRKVVGASVKDVVIMLSIRPVDIVIRTQQKFSGEIDAF